MSPKNNESSCTPEDVSRHCSALGFPLDRQQSGALACYLNLLVKWNRVMNLVGKPHWPDILAHLVTDSFHLALFLQNLDLPEEPECWDLGAGAGLPGVPLRIIWREGKYTLVDAREKRALFLRTVLASCPLPGVTVFQGRVESFMPQRPAADLIVSRAFMPWAKMLELVGGHVRSGAVCVFLTLAPLPAPLPERWEAAAEQRYLCGRDTRFLWAIRRV